MYAILEACQKEYDISSYEQYKWIEDDCIMEFSTNNVPILIAKATYIGSITCGKWTWSWRENEINTNCKSKLLALKEQGEKYNIDYLKNKSFKADENVAWVLSAMTAFLTEAKMVYKIERYETTEFYIFTRIFKLDV